MADRDLVRKDRQTSNTSTPQGKNYLLAIAINDYQHCTKLNNAVSDVEAFIEVLTSRYNFEKDNVTFIKDDKADKKSIERAFLNLIKLITPQDNLVVYFSGHGRYDEHFGGNWVPVEAGTSDNDWPDYLSNDLVKIYLSRINSFHTFLIADSCFSGAFFAERGKEKSLNNRVDTEPSRWALTSGKKEIVSDGQAGKRSPFAMALLDVLIKIEEPPSVMQICTLVTEKVASNAPQRPMGSTLDVSGHQGGQMVFYFRKENCFVDNRNGKTYQTARINGKTWMIQNLDIEIDPSAYYNRKDWFGPKYGRLYGWEAIKYSNLCPAGWRLPSKNDWEELISFYRLGVDKKIDFTSERNSSWKNMEEEFNLSLGGWFDYYEYKFYDNENLGLFWASEDLDKDHAYCYCFDPENVSIYQTKKNKAFGMSVRCIKEE